MSQNQPQADGERVADHAEESNRHEGHAEPGTGLDRRQHRNAAQTEEAARTAHKGAGKADAPDPTNP